MKRKGESFTAKFRSLENWVLVNFLNFSFSSKRELQIMSIVSSRGMFVNKDSTSKLAMTNWLRLILVISETNSNEFLTVNSFRVRGSRMGTRNFARS